MCLMFSNSFNSVEALFGKKEELTLWKMVRVEYRYYSNNQQHSDYCRTIANSQFIKAPYRNIRITTDRGYYVSNRKSVKLTRTEKDTTIIDKGIHVYTALPSRIGGAYKYLRVKCRKEDCVAASSDGRCEAVFTKVKLLPADIKKYKTAVRKKK